ncbi:histone acetyltransferase HAC1-like isoform X1 [Salvia splendens]|uniref:histone acetyltransferase HAC1-like isoform X1 n=1 Tax=Salvia splendens TaxID=180675 RepID=UPI001C265622|nr:histone acetyltransferase HAC1-like isoform X1 [Salvia splendens]
MQTHHSGQFPGQVPNQAGTMLPGLPQQNGNPMPNQIQNQSIIRGIQNTDPEYVKIRRYMQEKIWEFLMQRRQQSHEVSRKKMIDLVKRLEEALFKSAMTTDEYLNLATLESRLHILIKRLPMSNHSQQFSHTSSSPSIGTMIPTPGLQQSGSSNIKGTQSVDSSPMVNSNSNAVGPNGVNSGNYMMHGNGSSSHVRGGTFSSSDGALSGGYQQSSSAFSVNSGGNSMVTSMGSQRMASQMMPTPGFNNSNTSEVNSNANNQSFMNMESSNNVGTFQAGESSMPSQPMQQKQRSIGQNSRILHNIGGHMGGGIRSTLQQKSYGLSNGPLNGGLGMMGNNMSMMNGPGTTEGYLSGTVYGNSNKPMHQNFDQQQQPAMQGDGYGISASEASGSGDLYSSVGSMINNQSLNGVSIQSMPTTNSPMMINSQSHVHSVQQPTTTVSQPIDQSEKMNFQPQYSIRENLAQPHQHQQLQQQSHQFQRQHLVQNQVQQRLTQNQLAVKNEPFTQPHLSTNTVSEAKPGHGSENRDGSMQSRGSDPFGFSDIHNQFQHNSMEDRSRGQMLSNQSGPQDMTSSLSQSSDQMQQFLLPPQISNSESDFGGPPGGVQPDAALHGQWYSNSQDVSHVSGRLSQDQNVQDEFQHRLVGQDVAQLNNLSSEGSVIGQSDAFRSAEPPSTSNGTRRSNNLNRERQFKNQQRWLLFLRHARRCPAPEGKCQESNCLTVQKLLKHMEYCNVFQCPYPRCCATRVLLNHHRRCRDVSCPVCVPVKSYVQQAQMKALARAEINSRQANSVNGSSKSCDAAEISGMSMPKMSPVMHETPEDIHPSIKRMKIEQVPQPVVSETGTPAALSFAVNESPIQDSQHPEQYHDPHIPMEHESTQVKVEIPGSLGQLSSKNIEMKGDNSDDKYVQKPPKPEGDTTALKNPIGYGTLEIVKSEKEMGLPKMENPPLPSESTSKSGKPKIKGVSLTELFTPEQVRQHIAGLRRWVGQSKAKAEKNQAMEHSMSENSCQLCAVEKLAFEPPPIYCTPCGARVKRNNMYYTIGAGDTRHFFCILCYNETRGDTIVADGTPIPKARMEKKKNDEETEEWWVQCDKCEAWQHQICALFNGKRNDGGQAEYTCPNCYVEEVERGERVPLPQSAVLGAKDLPRTILSDHMEQRLFAKLKQERQDRARAQGKSYDEVPGAESLVVRVVSSVDKKLEVKPRFLEIFQEENYPMEYPYKSKVILLFQKIEGVEVCLFGMYVQEFGSECQQPNHRRVYLSYLDSVKYFRPDVKALSGEALRTYVYHEILIGYLDYCKKRGFTSCYIWACPPLKGEDYILYCHPEIQKTPKSDKLREWYLAMLRKAAKENIVVELTNLYDHFFVTTAECRAKVTAARLPYFDGDYWPGAAEDIIFQLQQDEDGRKQHKRGPLKKTITKRSLKASGQTDLSGNASKDLMLMHKLGETILTMKEDFIMVHLQPSCSHCCILMYSGKSWACRQCKNFQLCDRCYDVERKRDDRERHPINQKDKHSLYPVEINGVPDDTKDKDEILESEFFDTRQAFLSLCQGNHYQYDTLRRAKHSSMMVLYHLHNPTAPAFVTTCNVCNLDIETGQGWRCETCPEYDVCNACYSKDGGINHPHVLTNHPSNDRDAQNKEARQMRVTQLRKMLELLVHASQCRTLHCQYPNCRKVKGLFRHGMSCKIRASGGCVLCKKMWYLLQLHSRACKESKCSVPRCRDLNEHMRRLQQQSDSRRRAAVMEMMRQRATEVGGSS